MSGWEKRRSVPGQGDALHHREVLHENIPVWLGAQVSHSVADAQLDGSLQGRRCGLTQSHSGQDSVFQVQKGNDTAVSFRQKYVFLSFLFFFLPEPQILNTFQKCWYVEIESLKPWSVYGSYRKIIFLQGH